MRRVVDQFVNNCFTCQTAKAVKHGLFRILRILSISKRSCADISVDFVTDLLWFNMFVVVCVVMDQLMKMRHLIPYYSVINASQFTKLLILHVFKLHGFPGVVSFNCDP